MLTRALFISGLIFCVTGCRKDANIYPANGTVSVAVNGKPWFGRCIPEDGDRFSITVFNTDMQGDISESLSFFLFQKSLNEQRIYPADTLTNTNPGMARSNCFFGTVQGGCGSCEIFEVSQNDSLNNFLQITEQKNNYSEVSGIFEMTLIKTHGCEAAVYPDTLKLTSGKFRVKLR